MKMTRGKAFWMMVLGGAFFFTVCLPALTGANFASQTANPAGQGSSYFTFGAQTVAVPANSFWIVDDVQGPEEDTWVKLHSADNASFQVVAKCQHASWARPYQGLTYKAGDPDSTYLTSDGYQDLRVQGQMAGYIPLSSPTVAVTPNVNGILPGTTPTSSSGQSTLPVSNVCKGLGVVLGFVLIVVLITLVRRRFSRG